MTVRVISLPAPHGVVCERVFRTGLQQLHCYDGRWFMTIRNRRYSSVQPVPFENVVRWLRYFNTGREI